MKHNDIIDYTMILTGSIYSLANIEHILGIVILSIQLIWIISKLVYKVIEKIKKREPLEDLDEDVKDTIEDLTDIYEDLRGEDDEH